MSVDLATIEILAITLYANDRTNGNDPTRPSWMELPADDRHVYRMMARFITNPVENDPERGYT